MSKTKEMRGPERKAMLLEAGANLASKYGAQNVTRRMVAKDAKVSEGLVSLYLGDSATAQKAYARKAKAMGLTVPTKAQAEAIGVKLRKHKPSDKRAARKRTPREVEAIKRKAAPAKKSAAGAKASASATGKRTTKPKPTPRERKPKALPLPKLPVPQVGSALTPPERKSAARKPKAPPANLPMPEATPSS